MAKFQRSRQQRTNTPTKAERREKRSAKRSGRSNVLDMDTGAALATVIPIRNESIQTGPIQYKTPKQQTYHQMILSHTLTVGTGPAGTGKAQPLDSLVKTPTGWIKMGDVTPGTMVSTPDGNSANVTKIYPQGIKSIFSITFEDGRGAECCEEHLWRVYCYEWGNCEEKRWKVMNTAELYQKLQMKSMHDRLYIQLVKPNTDDKDIDLPLDPYLMGLIIGDGSIGHSCISFTTSDDFIVNEISKLLPTHLHLIKNTHGEYDYRIVKKEGRAQKDGTENDILNVFRSLSMTGLLSHTKTIPDMYLNGSYRQRLALLQGLMDTDGTVDSKSGTASFCTTSSILNSQFSYLIRSIGGISTTSLKMTKYTYNDELKHGRLAFINTVRLTDSSLLFRLPRKLGLIKKDYQYKNCLRLRVKNVEYVGEKEAQCISIDHPDHLYITDNYIVTHNTHIAATTAAIQLLEKKISKIIICRPAVESGRGLGFLPGEIGDKWAPYFKPVRSILDKRLGVSHVDNMIKNGQIEIAPIEYLRGSTFENAFVILDEAQNATKKEILTFLTRIGNNCTVVVDGDVEQIDIREPSGLVDMLERLRGMHSYAVCEFDESEIVRNAIVKEVICRYRR
jgi:phosphate starvation-inducible protein PhoH